VASKVNTGACSVVPEQTTITPVALPTNFNPTSSTPNMEG
jgi:hypothetical protein